MHIPDNYLSPVTCAVMGASMIPVWAVAVKKVKTEIAKEKLSMMGVGAAFSFLIMLFNVPLPGGTTGHAVGGMLLAVLLGPWAACISITIALLLQALLFGDGGILSFGANCFNMAFILPFTGYYIYKLIKERTSTSKGEYIGLALGSYLGINMAALCASIEFGIQPILFKDASGLPSYSPYPLSVTMPAMIIPHLLIAGIVEVLFTVAIFVFIKKTSPGTLYEVEKKRTPPVYALIAVLICLSPLGLLASGTAWGEWGANEIKDVISGGSSLGFVPSGMSKGFSFSSLMPDYTASGIPDFAGYILSAIIGVSILIIVFKLIALAKCKYNKGRIND